MHILIMKMIDILPAMLDYVWVSTGYENRWLFHLIFHNINPSLADWNLSLWIYFVACGVHFLCGI